MFLKQYVKKEFRGEIIEHIGIEHYIERDDLNPIKTMINLNNGMYDLETRQLIPHDPKYNSTIRIPVTFNPDAKCPTVDKFMGEVVTPENKVVLDEFIGYCLIQDVRFQRALMIFGHQGNGKSVFLNMAGKILGKPNKSAIPLQKLAHDKFAVSGLFEKLANICADIPSNKLKTDEVFKIAVGGDDDMNAEKKFMDQFEFKNYARLLFSANVLPEPAGDPDDNLAYFRRWVLVGFPNTFTGKNLNTKLINELTTEEEKSGYLNILIEALHTILDNGKFTYAKTAEENELIYKANMASIDKFYEECVIQSPENLNRVVSKTDMYNVYKVWCEKHGAISKSYIVFCGKLTKEKCVKTKRVGHSNESMWAGVMIRTGEFNGIEYDENGKVIEKHDEELPPFFETMSDI